MMTAPIPEASTWSTIPVNVAELQAGTECPTEDMYEPVPIWERPAGHAVQGVDAFKLTCHVNNLKEPATVVIGDTGAAPTLISQRYLESLKLSKPRPRAGRRLKLLQLTGSAGCSQYICLNLYFHSQLGPVCFKGVEAYIVKNMEANLLIGESMSQAWQLHTMHDGAASYWQVGNSPHRIPAALGPAPAEMFSVQWLPEEVRKPTTATAGRNQRDKN
jgi:hypothetical protein